MGWGSLVEKWVVLRIDHMVRNKVSRTHRHLAHNTGMDMDRRDHRVRMGHKGSHHLGRGI